eukprot:13891295-Alexandrium_andersonii.AAC.2
MSAPDRGSPTFADLKPRRVGRLAPRAFWGEGLGPGPRPPRRGPAAPSARVSQPVGLRSD